MRHSNVEAVEIGIMSKVIARSSDIIESCINSHNCSMTPVTPFLQEGLDLLQRASEVDRVTVVG